MSRHATLIMAFVFLTALLAGFGASYVDQHERLTQSHPPVVMASVTPG